MAIHGAGHIAHAAIALNIGLMQHLANAGILKNEDAEAILNRAIGSVRKLPDADKIAAVLNDLAS